MEHPHYGHLLRILHWCTTQSITAALEQMELTSSQSRIIGYLSHRDTPPCPKDVEDEFRLSHPTVSGILSRLEQKGFITLVPDPDDHRKKRIHLLEKGRSCDAHIHSVIQTTEDRIVSGFTPEEQQQFFELLRRAITNMGGDLTFRPHKEEPKK